MTNKEITNYYYLIGKAYELRGKDNDFSVLNNYEKTLLTLLPRKLYKYRDCNHDKRDIITLKNRQVYFNSIDNWLDKQEMKIKFNLKKDEHYIKNHFEELSIKLSYKLYLNKASLNNITFSDFERLYKKFFKCACIKNDKLNITLIDNLKLKEINNSIKKAQHILNGSLLNCAVDGSFNRMLNTDKDVAKKNMFYCLTERPNNEYLWSEYADKNKGFCIEYDIQKVFEEKPEIIYSLMPMRYGNRRKISMIDFVLAGVSNTEERNQYQFNYTDKMFTHLLTKRKKFSLEEEWRLICNRSVSNFVDFDYASAIYLGSKIDKENEYLLKNVANELGIPVYKT